MSPSIYEFLIAGSSMTDTVQCSHNLWMSRGADHGRSTAQDGVVRELRPGGQGAEQWQAPGTPRLDRARRAHRGLSGAHSRAGPDVSVRAPAGAQAGRADHREAA